MKPAEMYSLQGKVAMVAGGGGGIGSKLAAGLCEAGAEIAIVDRSGSLLKSTCSLVEELGKEPLSIAADLTNAEEAEAAVAQTVARFGSLDIIVNAIGGGAGKVLFEAQDYPMDAWQWIMDLNLTTTLVATQAAVKAMIAGGKGGKVLNISSVRGQLGINAGYSAYVAAKGAVSSLTRQWATEWAKYGITVNAIAPTFVDTPQVAMLLDDPDFKAGLISRVPLGRVGTPEDLMGAVLMFCSGASQFITGQILTIDGGLTATQ
ncbi:MAG: SDR family oxidoreductase [Actinobacteria bacterium]|jgi:gluconate 5-dehydrogenase|nr:SDR family oxidoreductase [Actinomycetota bacterium]MBU1492436.1 SDR family oxidoreductase [Actinomycetota bacterium]